MAGEFDDWFCEFVPEIRSWNARVLREQFLVVTLLFHLPEHYRSVSQSDPFFETQFIPLAQSKGRLACIQPPSALSLLSLLCALCGLSSLAGSSRWTECTQRNKGVPRRPSSARRNLPVPTADRRSYTSRPAQDTAGVDPLHFGYLASGRCLC